MFGKRNLRHWSQWQLSAPHSDKYCSCSLQDVTQIYFQDFGLSRKSISRTVMSELFFSQPVRRRSRAEDLAGANQCQHRTKTSSGNGMQNIMLCLLGATGWNHGVRNLLECLAAELECASVGSGSIASCPRKLNLCLDIGLSATTGLFFFHASPVSCKHVFMTCASATSCLHM